MDYRDDDYEYADMDSRYTGNRNLYCELCYRRCRGIYHVIEKGDTLYSLGKRYHVSVSELMRANPYVNVYNLRVGEELCIPVRPQPRMGNMREESQQEMDRNMQREMDMQREMNMRQNMNADMQRGRDVMQELSSTSESGKTVTEEELKAEEHTSENCQFSETDTIREVLDKTGLSMSDFVKFLAEKID